MIFILFLSHPKDKYFLLFDEKLDEFSLLIIKQVSVLIFHFDQLFQLDFVILFSVFLSSSIDDHQTAILNVLECFKSLMEVFY